jgi:hypothetical protein
MRLKVGQQRMKRALEVHVSGGERSGGAEKQLRVLESP